MAELNSGVKRSRGRPKGAKSRLPAEAKEVVAAAAACLGGTERLILWAKEDPKHEYAFWTIIYPKLLPLTVTANATLSINWPVNAPGIES